MKFRAKLVSFTLVLSLLIHVGSALAGNEGYQVLDPSWIASEVATIDSRSTPTHSSLKHSILQDLTYWQASLDKYQRFKKVLLADRNAVMQISSIELVDLTDVDIHRTVYFHEQQLSYLERVNAIQQYMLRFQERNFNQELARIILQLIHAKDDGRKQIMESGFKELKEIVLPIMAIQIGGQLLVAVGIEAAGLSSSSGGLPSIPELTEATARVLSQFNSPRPLIYAAIGSAPIWILGTVTGLSKALDRGSLYDELHRYLDRGALVLPTGSVSYQDLGINFVAILADLQKYFADNQNSLSGFLLNRRAQACAAYLSQPAKISDEKERLRRIFE